MLPGRKGDPNSDFAALYTGQGLRLCFMLEPGNILVIYLNNQLRLVFLLTKLELYIKLVRK